MIKSQDIPVLLILFNRPDQAKKLLLQVKKNNIRNLYISIDGPRHEEDESNIEKIIENITNLFNEEINLRIQRLDKNLGCGLGPRKAISWFFENEDMGIILEDDCIPSDSFFKFCSQLLIRYKDEKKIWMISGDNGGPILNKDLFNDNDYLFSSVPLIWGWATWKDRWEAYDDDLDNWKKSIFKNIKYLKHVNIFEKYVVYKLCKNSSNTKVKNFWDFQMYSTMMKNSAFTIVPKLNLISNIGWGPTATHTLNENFRSFSEAKDFSISKFHDDITLNKKINNLITYSIHTNVKKNIIDKDIVFLMRIYYLYERFLNYLKMSKNILINNK